MEFIRVKKFTDPLFYEKKSKFKEDPQTRITAYHYSDQAITLGLSNGQMMQFRKKGFDTKHFLQSKDYEILKPVENKNNHKGEIRCLIIEKFSDSYYIFTGSADRTIKLWENDIKKGCIQTLFGHTGSIMALAFAQDSLFSASNDKVLRIWKQESGREFMYHPWFVTVQIIYDFSMKKSLNQQSYITAFLVKMPQFQLYAGDTDGSLHLFMNSQPTLQQQQTYVKLEKSFFTFHRLHVIQIIEVEKDNAIFSIAFDQKILGYGESGGKFFSYKNPHKCLFTSIRWSQTHQELIASDEQGRVYFMNISSDKQVLEFKLYECKILGIDLIDHLEALVVYTEQFIDVLRIKRGVRTGNLLDQHKGPVIEILGIDCPQEFEPKKLVSASLDNTIRVWDSKDMSCISTIETGEKNEISSMHYLTNANLVATGHDNGEIRLWNIEIGSFLIIDQSKAKSKHNNTVCALTSCTFDSEEYMFSSGYDGRINVWEIFERKQRLMASYIMPQLKQSLLANPKSTADSLGNEILCLLFDKTTKRIIAAGNKCTIYLINMFTYEHDDSFVGHQDSITCLALDGKILFSGSHDKTIRLWNLNNNQALTYFSGLDHPIQKLLVIPETGYLVSVGNGLLLTWDYPNKKVISKFTKPETFKCIAYLDKALFIGTEENNIHSYTQENNFEDIDKQYQMIDVNQEIDDDYMKKIIEQNQQILQEFQQQQ
ncbi:unnamed protein product [Paramecium pentaurelia]|uniref:Uncharacterized protein n=1 Tax=Paramecium pentaurelia TaxID=43138 RepID=A0A8S1U7P9_9CILI|nr:unnamed protein product [Paramecium pentaurelia]